MDESRAKDFKSLVDVSSDYAQSRDLRLHVCAVCADEEQDDALFIFREKTDFVNVQFKVGMKFNSFVLLKVGIKEYVISGGQNM